MFTGKVVVFDIDGTLANIEHRRHWVAGKPKNWAAFNAAMILDTVYEDIRWLLDSIRLRDNGRIIICSGRGEENRAVTEQWLNDNSIFYDALYMRAEKDNRSDAIVKVELLNDIQRDYGWPYIWFDDRQRVVNAIRQQGVRVCQVAPGNF